LDAVVATSDACSFGIGVDYSSTKTICTGGASVDDAFTASTCEITESTRLDGDDGRREWRWRRRRQVTGNRSTDVIAESSGIVATTVVGDGRVSCSWRR
jgi:hypothetical protein